MSFHLFHIAELFSNADGSVQFIEFVGDANDERFWAGHSLISTNGAVTHSFEFPANLPSSSTAGRSVLEATQGFAALGLVNPDYIVPNGFLFTAGGTVSVPGMDQVVHGALPTTGTLSLDDSGAVGIASPTNFAGATSTIPGNPIAGTAGGDNLLGTVGGDYIVGMGGSDRLNGGAGDDTMIGGSGNDSYVVDSAGDTVTEPSSIGGTDTVTSTVTWTLGANVEFLTLGGALAINGTGNTHGNRIVGNEAANRIDGRDGDDQLLGLGGDDTLSGGQGRDVLSGGAGDDSLGGGWGPDTLDGGDGNDLMTGGSGNDSLAGGIGNDRLDGGTGDDRFDGGNGRDTLLGGAGYDSLGGGAGNDRLEGGDGFDSLYGGTGRDTMIGGKGPDRYNVDNVGDVVIEGIEPASDSDTVTTRLSYALGPNVEYLQMLGSDAIDGTGNELGNYLLGNAGDNWLVGGAGDDFLHGGYGDANDTLRGNSGNDRLDGGSGSDNLSGGSGADVFVFAANEATNRDSITDFNPAADRFELYRSVFTALGEAGPLASRAFHTGTAATEARQRIVYDIDSGTLFYDADGVGELAAVAFGVVTSGVVLDADQFWVV